MNITEFSQISSGYLINNWNQITSKTNTFTQYLFGGSSQVPSQSPINAQDWTTKSTCEESENQYLQWYPKEVAQRMKQRENALLDPYRPAFQNLVTQFISPNMPFEEAELLLHYMSAMTPEQRKEFSRVIEPLLSTLDTETFKELKTDIIRLLLDLGVNYPDRFELIQKLISTERSPHHICIILEAMSRSDEGAITEENSLNNAAHRLIEIENAVGSINYKASDIPNIVLMVCSMNRIFEYQCREILNIAKDRQISLKTLINLVKTLEFCRRINGEILILFNKIMPRNLNERQLEIVFSMLSGGTLLEINEWFEKDDLKIALEILFNKSPSINENLLKSVIDGLICSDNPVKEVERSLRNLEIKSQESLRSFSDSHKGQPNTANTAVCPFQRICALPSMKKDPVAMREALHYHRFDQKTFGYQNPSSVNEASVFTCSKNNTPRLRKIFLDLMQDKKSQPRLMAIVEDRIGPLFDLANRPYSEADLNKCLIEIASHILEDIPVVFRERGAQLDPNSCSGTELYKQLIHRGYTPEEIHRNFEILASVTVGQNMNFLPPLIQRLRSNDPIVHESLETIRQKLEKEMGGGRNIWDAIDSVKEIDLFILEALRMSQQSTISRQLTTDESISLNLDSNQLALRPDLVGEKPEEFRPSRLVESTDKPIGSFWPSTASWMPFGDGMHRCPAWSLYRIISCYMLAKTALTYAG